MRAAWLAAFLALAACLPARAQDEGDGRGRAGLLRMNGFLLFSRSDGPLSFVVPAGRPEGVSDIGEVKARSCQHGLAIPITASLRPTSISGAAGNGGYVKALEKLKAQRPELAGIYDVRIDMHVISVLGVYRRLCTELIARGFR